MPNAVPFLLEIFIHVRRERVLTVKLSSLSHYSISLATPYPYITPLTRWPLSDLLQSSKLLQLSIQTFAAQNNHSGKTKLLTDASAPHYPMLPIRLF